MNLPRLIIADEIRPGTVSSGVILVYALRRLGIKVKVFTCGRNELDVCLLNLLLEETTASLDTYACSSMKNVKTLFQRTALPDAMNIVLVPLGDRTAEDFLSVRPEAMELAKGLACPVLTVIESSALNVITAQVAGSVLSVFESEQGNQLLGVVFSGVKNPREYQLLEQEFGRKTPILSLGYIPKETERPMPQLSGLRGPSAGTRLMQIKSAILQLISIPHQVDWQIIDSFGRINPGWTPVEENHYAPKNFIAAIMGEKDFSLESANARELFQYLGCQVVDYSPLRDPFPSDAEVLYFPHSSAAWDAEILFAQDKFTRGVKQSFAANKLIFANGASSLLFTKSFVGPDKVQREGFGFFPFRARYSVIKPDEDYKRIEIRCTSESIFNNEEEKMKGYALSYLSVSNPGSIVPPVWAYRDVRRGTELGASGWVKSYCFVTDLYVELWSNIDSVNRWLSLRKR